VQANAPSGLAPQCLFDKMLRRVKAAWCADRRALDHSVDAGHQFHFVRGVKTV
jgi:hypothetical protein